MRIAEVLLVAIFAATSASAQDDTPYWASIASGKANMRTGPGKTYPTTWVYQRRDLPVLVHQRYDNWRRIEGPGGAEGWMAVALLSETRTGMIVGDDVALVYDEPDTDSAVRYRVEPGVVGRLSKCDGRWCRFIMNRPTGERAIGWIMQGQLWGVDEDERFED